MSNSHWLFLLPVFLLTACTDSPESDSSPMGIPSGSLSLNGIQTTPDSFYPDTLTRSSMTFRIRMTIRTSEQTTIRATLHLTDPSGYSSSVSTDFSVWPASTDYTEYFTIPVNREIIIKPVLSLRLGTIGGKEDVIQSPVVKTLTPVTGPPVIDSIRFQPAFQTIRGASFTMSVWASDPRGPNHIDKITVYGKRPDGTAQTPFTMPKIGPGFYSLTSQVPATAQVGFYEWKFVAVNLSGTAGTPVTRTYQVIP